MCYAIGLRFQGREQGDRLRRWCKETRRLTRRLTARWEEVREWGRHAAELPSCREGDYNNSVESFKHQYSHTSMAPVLLDCISTKSTTWTREVRTHVLANLHNSRGREYG